MNSEVKFNKARVYGTDNRHPIPKIVYR